NLSLRVRTKRPDGFHEIESLITPISLYDTIDIEKQNRWIDLSCDDPHLSTGDDNLVVRAAKAFFAHTKIQSGVSIKLEKKIPHGAGLGGGSSDAAATLRCLNDLFNANLSLQELAMLASGIGSDVPFFLYDSAAVCKGRGEVVEPIRLKKKLRLGLFKPAFGVPTAWAYGRWGEASRPQDALSRPQDLEGQTFFNDLEPPVFEKFIFLRELKRWLLRQEEVAVALMSGSGSTVFAILQDSLGSSLAERARKELDRKIWTHVADTLSG